MNNRHRKIIQLIVLYMENKLSETQQDELTAWLEEDEKNRSFFQQVISPEKRLQKFETRKHIDSEKAFSKFKKNTQPHKVKSIYRLSRYDYFSRPRTRGTCLFTCESRANNP